MSKTMTAEPWCCLMLHAAGSSPRALGALKTRLEGHGIQVAAPLLPMRVTGEDRSRGVPFAPHVALARAALNEMGDARRLVFGHSFGALIALLTLLEGERIDAAVLFEPIVLATLTGSDPGDQDARSWDKALIDHLDASVIAGNPEAGVSRFIEAYNEAKWSDLPEHARAGIVADAANIRDVARAVHHLPLSLEAIASIDTSIVVVSGTRTLDIARRMTARLTRLLPNASRADVRGGGHMAPTRMPDALFDLMVPVLGTS